MNSTTNHPSEGNSADVDRDALAEPQPADGPSRAEIEVSLENWTVARPKTSPARRPGSLPRADRQFSLGELMLATTFAAFGTALAQGEPGVVSAGVIGGVTLVAILGLSVCAPQSRALRLTWWSLFAMYLGAAGTTVCRTWYGLPPLWER